MHRFSIPQKVVTPVILAILGHAIFVWIRFEKMEVRLDERLSSLKRELSLFVDNFEKRVTSLENYVYRSSAAPKSKPELKKEIVYLEEDLAELKLLLETDLHDGDYIGT